MKRPKLEMADWHVSLRGARRLLLFHDKEDYQTFYGMLGYSCERSGIEPIANCLMSNHFHLCLNGSSKQLTTCMWHLDRHYSGYHNEKYNLSGHAFEQGYYRGPILSSFILKRVVRYIHLNPVRAGIAGRPEGYPWSNFLRIVRGSEESLGHSELRFLTALNPDLAQARTEYSAFVEKDLRRPVARPPARTAAWEIWQEQFGWFLDFARESQDRLYPLQAEDVAAWWAVRSGVPPRVIGKALGDLDGRRVSQVCFKLSRRLEKDPGLQFRVQSLQVL